MTTKIKRDGTVLLADGDEAIRIGRVEKYRSRTTHYCGGAYSRVAAGFTYNTYWAAYDVTGRKIWDSARTRASVVEVLVEKFNAGKIRGEVD